MSAWMQGHHPPSMSVAYRCGGTPLSSELPADWMVLVAGGLLAVGVLGAGFANRLRAPGLLLFLAIGMVIADDGLALVTLNEPVFAQGVGTVALVIILFEGGLTTKPRDLRAAAAPGAILATLGVVITAVVVAGGAALLFAVDDLTAVLLGSVVASTDAAAVFDVLRRAPLPRRLTSLLEVESGGNDPVAVMLTIGALETWQRTPALSEWVLFGLRQLGGGVFIGVLVGLAGAWLLNRVRLGAGGLYPVLALALAGLAYGVTASFGGSGFLAVYAAGLLIGARVPRHRRTIRTFHEGLAAGSSIGLFLLLGILVFPSDLPAVTIPALLIAGILVFVARPIAVLLCLPLFGYGWRDLALLSWAGLRGAVPIVLATFPLAAGHPDGRLIFNVVFFVVIVSAALQGLTVGWVADRLGLRSEGRIWSPVAEVLPLDEVDGVEAELVEVDVREDLHVAGRQLREVPLPEGGLATTLLRDGRALIPTGSTRLEGGDVLLVAMPRRQGAATRLVAWARGEQHQREAEDAE